MLRVVAVHITPWKVLSTGSTLPQNDTNMYFCHLHTKRALLSSFILCDRFSEAFDLQSITSPVWVSGYSYKAIIILFRLTVTNLQRKGMEKWQFEAECHFVERTYYLGRLFSKKNLTCIVQFANLICVLVQGSVLTLLAVFEEPRNSDMGAVGACGGAPPKNH
jgi:hypothetical protein